MVNGVSGGGGGGELVLCCCAMAKVGRGIRGGGRGMVQGRTDVYDVMI